MKIWCLNTLVIISFFILLSGCVHVRSATVVNVPDVGDCIETKYRYCYVGKAIKLGSNGNSNGYSLSLSNSDLKKLLPNVFAEDGIPFTAITHMGRQSSYGQSDAARLGYFLLYMCSAGTAPFVQGSTVSQYINLKVMDSVSKGDDLSVCSKLDDAASLFSPVALLFFHGTPSFDGYDANNSKIFKADKIGLGAQTVNSEDKAIAYGIAYCLKRMEESGKITEEDMRRTEALRKKRREDEMRAFFNPPPTQSRTPSGGQRQVVVPKVQNGEASVVSIAGKPSYSLESFRWEDDGNFAATFRVKMHGECSIDSFFAIRQAFDAQIRNAYLQSHPSTNSQHLQIDVRPNLENGMISGRVAVLTIEPVSLSYDANSRRGRLSVRFNTGQMEETRAWLRRNIEVLARDKNIALVTGHLPPEATYYSLGEKIDGNVMEIEFKTE